MLQHKMDSIEGFYNSLIFEGWRLQFTQEMIHNLGTLFMALSSVSELQHFLVVHLPGVVAGHLDQKLVQFIL